MPHATINGARLWYEVRGTGKPILLHHGYTACRENWMPVAERLQDRYQIILMEGRGTGDSEHTADGYTLEQYAADVVGMLDHLDIQSLTFAGHSMAGGIGYLLALEYAERLDNLILMAPIPSQGTGEINPEVREQRLAERRNGDRAAILKRYQTMKFLPEAETDEWIAHRVDQVLSVSEGHFEQSAMAMSSFDVQARIPQLKTPTLMIAGAVDSLLEANLADFQRLPNATLDVISRAGHEVAVHAPERVSQCIDQFMEHGVITAQMLMNRLS